MRYIVGKILLNTSNIYVYKSYFGTNMTMRHFLHVIYLVHLVFIVLFSIYIRVGILATIIE